MELEKRLDYWRIVLFRSLAEKFVEKEKLFRIKAKQEKALKDKEIKQSQKKTELEENQKRKASLEIQRQDSSAKTPAIQSGDSGSGGFWKKLTSNQLFGSVGAASSSSTASLPSSSTSSTGATGGASAFSSSTAA